MVIKFNKTVTLHRIKKYQGAKLRCSKNLKSTLKKTFYLIKNNVNYDLNT